MREVAMRKLAYLMIVLGFVLSMAPGQLYSKKKKSFIKSEEFEKISTIAVIPFCPTEGKMHSKKYNQLGRAAGYITTKQLRKLIMSNDYEVDVLSYREVRKKLKKLGHSYKCLGEDVDYGKLARQLKVDTIITGVVLKAKTYNGSGALDVIWDPAGAAVAQTVKVKVKYYVYRKGKLIAYKKITEKLEGDIFSNSLAANIVSNVYETLDISEKYKRYLPALVEAANRFVKWIEDYLPMED